MLLVANVYCKEKCEIIFSLSMAHRVMNNRNTVCIIFKNCFLSFYFYLGRDSNVHVSGNYGNDINLYLSLCQRKIKYHSDMAKHQIFQVYFKEREAQVTGLLHTIKWVTGMCSSKSSGTANTRHHRKEFFHVFIYYARLYSIGVSLLNRFVEISWNMCNHL